MPVKARLNPVSSNLMAGMIAGKLVQSGDGLFLVIDSYQRGRSFRRILQLLGSRQCLPRGESKSASESTEEELLHTSAYLLYSIFRSSHDYPWQRWRAHASVQSDRRLYKLLVPFLCLMSICRWPPHPHLPVVCLLLVLQ